MKTFWNRITLQCYRHPDEKPMPWYAWPLAALFVAWWLGADLLLTVSGF